MTVNLSPSGVIELSGQCTAEDAETLLQRLLSAPSSTIDWKGCESIHAAVIQVLLVARKAPIGSPASRFLTELVAPLLKRQAQLVPH